LARLAEDDKDGVMAEKVLKLFWSLAHSQDVTVEIMDQVRVLRTYRNRLILNNNVADPDPGSGAFLTPGSGIRNRFFPDPGSQIHIF
jgi:hypothetical protein